MKTFDDHLKEREAQAYASTRRWTPKAHQYGLRGERALAEYFGAKQDLTNKPGGDGGVDIELALRSAAGEHWFKADAKASPYGDYLRVDCKKLHPQTIYVLVHLAAADVCVGWEWGSVIARVPTTNWCGNGVYVHALWHEQLRDMAELKERYVDYRHAPAPLSL